MVWPFLFAVACGAGSTSIGITTRQMIGFRRRLRRHLAHHRELRVARPGTLVPLALGCWAAGRLHSSRAGLSRLTPGTPRRPARTWPASPCSSAALIPGQPAPERRATP